MGGGGGSETNSDPWSGQQPYLNNMYVNADALYGSGVGQSYYPGNTVSPFAPQTQMGFDALMARGAGTPQQWQMGDYLNQSMANTGVGQQAMTAGGGFLGSNPFLDSVYNTGAKKITDSFNQEIMPGLNSTFGGGGRTGSGMHQLYAGEAAGEAQDALGNLAAGIYAPAYESERNRMVDAASGLNQQAFQSASLTPMFNDMGRANIQDVLSVGGAVENQAQNLIGADMNRYNFGQQAPWDMLMNYSNIVNGLPGSYGTAQTQTEPNPWAGAVGGGMAGSSFGPYGAAIGAGLGYLASS